MKYDIPILIIAFNRPDVSMQTFEAIRRLKPSNLYVAIDGARENVKGEEDIVKQVLSVYKRIDWPCNANYHFNEKNEGAEITVSRAISWVLSFHEYCVILEDDVLATQAFFDFALQMLMKYKDTKQVYQISAAQFTPMESMQTDYVFSLYGHTGFGWATWRRAWDFFSMDLHDFDKTIADKEIKFSFSCPQAYKSFLYSIKRMKARGSKNCSWDQCWSYVRLRDRGLSIVPRCNLTQNIGVWGLHAHGESDYHHFMPSEGFQAVIHPNKIEIDFNYDRYHFQNYLHHSITSKVFATIRSFFNK